MAVVSSAAVEVERVPLEPRQQTVDRTELVVMPATYRPLHSIHHKRVLDVVGALLLLVLFAPLCIATALVLRVSSRGPIFFRQSRVGAAGRPFLMYKFRSMRVDAEEVLQADPALYARYLANDHKLPAAEDPRIAPAGRLMRSMSIDELPQLWNVLRGDMSLVGPRPVTAPQYEQYGEAGWVYRAARPGLTGAWQVNGRSLVDFAGRVALDQRYVENWTFGSDLAILLRTPKAVVSGRGAF
jgi:lipopolysaccharide/colanic/teichoic acid biosynthesis glycosyltransferase